MHFLFQVPNLIDLMLAHVAVFSEGVSVNNYIVGIMYGICIYCTSFYIHSIWYIHIYICILIVHILNRKSVIYAVILFMW